MFIIFAAQRHNINMLQVFYAFLARTFTL